MDIEAQKEFAKVIADGIKEADSNVNPINPQNIIYSVGVAAVIFVGWSFNSNQEANAEMAAQNSEKLEQLTAAVSRLVTYNESQQSELSKRGEWMGNINTYSEESRMKDQDHDLRIERIEKELELKR